MNQIINNRIMNLNRMAQTVIVVGLVFVSVLINTNLVYADDTTPANVEINYNLNPMGAGSRTITASYSEPIQSAPTISIDQPGTADVTNATMTSSPLNLWKRTGPSESNYWRSVTYGNGLFVAVTDSGTNRVMTSPDGITWTSRTAPSSSWFAVTYGNGLFVATGSGVVMTSPDGINWTNRTITETSLTWYSVTYGNGLFVATAFSTNKIITSPDGINWTTRTMSSSTSLYSITYGNGMFVAVGSGYWVTSPDGINWSQRYISTTYVSIAYGNGMFLAVGPIAYTTSTNGTYSSSKSYPANYGQIGLVTYTNDMFVAAETSGSSYKIIKTTDGINWSSVDSPINTAWNSLAYGNGTIVIVFGYGNIAYSKYYSYSYNYSVGQSDGSSYKDGTATVSLSPTVDLAGNTSNLPTNNTFVIDTVKADVNISYSANPANVGINTITATYSKPLSVAPTISIDQPGTSDITNATMNPPGSIWSVKNTQQSSSWKSIVYGNGLFVAVSQNSTNRVMTSPDGINWTSRTAPSAGWSSIVYGNGLFVAVGNSLVMTSPDGINWTSRSAPSSNWYSVTYGNGLFVAVAYSYSSGTNQVMTSPDGINWTTRTSPSSKWYSVTYGNNMFVAVSSSSSDTNCAMTSPDGINWTLRDTLSNYLYSITYGNGMFVAAGWGGSGNKLIYSDDGISWHSSNNSLSYFNFVSYGNGLFVAIGSLSNQNTGITISKDGMNWTVIQTTTLQASFDWYSASYGNGLFVAVGSSGYTMVSPFSYSYNYSVGQSDGSNYIDGTATVSLSSSLDSSGNIANLPTNNTFTINTAGPSVVLSYSTNPAKSGINTITATYSSPVTSAPYISINQQGTTDISNVAMSGSGNIWTYNYTVNTADGSNYIDGLASVILSTVTDNLGNKSKEPSNASFNIDTIKPVALFSYDSDVSKTGPNTIYVTYNEEVKTPPFISVDQQGSSDIANNVISKTIDPYNNFTSSRTIKTNSFKSVTYGNGLFVAVSSDGTNRVSTSLDGVNWVLRDASENNYWYSVTYGNGLFVAVSQDGTNRVMTSSDGVNWISRSTPSSSWVSVTYGNGLFVAVATSGTNRVMTSPDGITWTARIASEANSWQSVTYGNGLFVAVASSGTNQVMTSPDGINWTARTAPSSSWTSVTYGNGLFVAVAGSGTNRIMTSSDGVNWTSRTAPSSSWYSVTYGNGLFVAVAYSGTNQVMTSPDGINWTTRTVPEANNWYSVTYGNGLFVAVASSGNYRAMSSLLNSYSYVYNVNQDNNSDYKDGKANITLSTISDLAGNSVSLTSSFVIDTKSPNPSISYSNDVTDIGTQSIKITYPEPVTSTPNISIDQPGSIDVSNASITPPLTVWTERTSNLLSSHDIYSSAYGNGLFVALATNGNYATSTDGINWTPRSVTNGNWYSITYGNGMFVAVGGGGYTMSSTNGINWTVKAAPETNNWMSVTYGNGLFVAVAGSGTNRIMTSSDGVNWVVRLISSYIWQSVAYGNGMFIAVDYGGGNVIQSYDGINWFSVKSDIGAVGWPYKIVYGGNTFVISNMYGNVWSSSTGFNWVSRKGSMTASWSSVGYVNGLFVVLSYSTEGKIGVSVDGKNWSVYSNSNLVNLRSITYGNGLVVVTSNNSKIFTSPWDGSYYYNYTVNKADGSNYKDGNATVSMSPVSDLAGNVSTTTLNNTFEINTTNPSVVMSYNKSPVGIGTLTITATYNKPVVSSPNISIDQPGSTDISNVAMTNSGNNKVFTYTYTVNKANGTSYIDGTATVSLSSVLDATGKTADAPTNTTFTIETVPPTAGITYSIPHAVKSGDSQLITATFNEPMADTPIPQVSISGANTLSATNMTKVDSTHYTYSYTVGAGNGTGTVAMSNGTDIGTNPVVTAPTSGATFKIDNMAPADTVDTICNISGNGCTTSGALKTPQEVYTLAVISGTSSDETDGSGVSKVDISIKDTNTNKYYNGALFNSDTESYFTSTGTTSWTYDSSSASLSIGHVYTINAKVYDIAGNSYIASKQFKFVNAPPVVTNVTASQTIGTNTINVSYDVTDIESAQTTNSLFYQSDATLTSGLSDTDTNIYVSDSTHLPSSGVIMVDEEEMSYTKEGGAIVRGALSTSPASHSAGSYVYIKASTVSGSGIGLSNKGTGKSIVWDASTDASGYENANGIIRVVANDGSAGSMIGYMDSSPIVLDFKKPESSIVFDAGVAGQTGSATISMTKPMDISSVEYRIMDDSLTEANPKDTGWVAISEDTTIPWNFDSDIEVKTLKYQFRDVYGNTSSEKMISTDVPVPSSSFIVQDTSNISAVPPYYDMYIGWQTASGADFASYKLEYSTSDDNTAYDTYQTINSSSFLDRNTNYYIFRNLDSSKYYRFRLGVVSVNGTISVRSNSYVTTKPDGVQNYSEGGGGAVATAPRVENVLVSQQNDGSVDITYKISDSSFSKKFNPSYEGYVFYNIGVTVSSYDVNTITLSNGSKLKSSGYILVNNEVIGYTSKNGNVLSGLVRGTWPKNNGRLTRVNTSIFNGTLVWILASGTAPTSIISDSITTGQNDSIHWDTYTESNLAGSSYPNVGVKVLVHDNQDALSGPLSNQNDFSEDGVLENLDLNAPAVSFAQADASGADTSTPVSISVNLSRKYPLQTTVDYTVSGTATGGGVDYTLASGTLVFDAGEITKTITADIIHHQLFKPSQTIVLTLSNPVNGVLGDTSVYTYTITNDASSSQVEFDGTSSSGSESIPSVEIPIKLSAVSGSDVTVDYTVSGTATGGGVDYILSSGKVTIVAGDLTGKITATITNDTLQENPETIIVTLSSPVNASLGANSTYTYTIIDEDSLPMIGFPTNSSEGKMSVENVDIPVSISSVYPEDITVDYAVAGGTAVNGADYDLSNSTLTIKSGQTMTTIKVQITKTTVSAPDKTIIIALSNPTNAVFGENTSFTYTIVNDNIPVTNLSGSEVKSTSALVTWTTADFANSTVQYGTVDPSQDGAYNMTKTIDEPVLSHRVRLGGLAPQTKYYFKTVSTTLSGETTTTESDFTTTSGPVISEIVTNDITDTSIKISWKTDVPSDSYVYYENNSTMLTPARLGSEEKVTDHVVTLINLNPKTTYYYFVQSSDENGGITEDANTGDYYNFDTSEDQTPPTVSDISTPIITSDSVAIVWKTNEPSDSQVLYGIATGSYTSSSDLNTNLVLNHLITITGLNPETQYYYVIKSTDEKGNLTTTDEQTFTTIKVTEKIIHTGGGGSVGVLQSVYDDLLEENEANKAKLKSQDSTAPEISSSEISTITPFGITINIETNEDTVAFVRYGKDTNYGDASGDQEFSTKHTINIRGLTMGTEYHYKIFAMDRSSNQKSSEDKTFKTKFLSESLEEMKNIDNVEQFQKEIESTIESILPSLVPPFVTDPKISEITENSAIVTFKTNIKAFPVVGYSTDAEFNKSQDDPYTMEASDVNTKDYTHQIKLTNLKSNTKYHIQARAFSLPKVIGKSEDLVFTTSASKIQGYVTDVKKDSFVVIWMTDEPTTSVIEYKNLDTGRIAMVTDESEITSHSVKIENLSPGNRYEVSISGVNSKGNNVESDHTLIVSTSTDNIPPVISNLKIDSSLSSGRVDKAQAIVSWQTDEPSTSVVYFDEGTSSSTNLPVNKQSNTELTKNHVILLSSLKPGAVYRFTVESMDDANNVARPDIRTMITPKKAESIVDVIFKNFNSTFDFVNNIK